MYVDNSWLSLDPIYLLLLHATRILGQFLGHGWISRWRIHLSAGCFAIPSYWSTIIWAIPFRLCRMMVWCIAVWLYFNARSSYLKNLFLNILFICPLLHPYGEFFLVIFVCIEDPNFYQNYNNLLEFVNCQINKSSLE